MSVLHRKAKLEGPVEYTHGEYYGKDDQTFYMFNPVQYSGGIDARVQNTDRGNKYEVIPYSDTTGVEPCPGVTLENVEAYTTAPEISVGNNYARELGLIRSGIIEMVYQAGTTSPYAGMKIAPYPGGFQQWKHGMFCLGVLLTEPGKTVDFADDEYIRTFRVRIDIKEEPLPETDTQTLTIDTTNAGDHFVTLPHPYKIIRNVFDKGATSVAGLVLVEGDFTVNADEYTMASTTKMNVADSVVGPLIVNYEW